VYAVAGKGGERRAYHSLRDGKKARIRRLFKRRARRAAKDEIDFSS